jgi:hypothetical protein
MPSSQPETLIRRTLVNSVLVLALMIPGAGFADTPKLPDVLKLPPDNPKLDSKAQKEAPTAFAAKEPEPILHWGTGDGKSYLVPAYEIVGFEFALNRFNHYVIDEQTYGSPTSDFRQNIHRRWIIDNDKFSTNQFLHPYQGSVFHGLARSSGLNFWEGMGYSFAGSLLWKEAGEHSVPSINDQITTTFAGPFLGEPLFRIASLLLESSGNGHPGFWRELGATAISPTTGFNRLVYGDRFAAVFRSNDPAVFTRIDLGATLNAHFSSNVNVNPDPAGPPAAQTLQRKQASLDFTMGYGLPGKPGYTYTRPFDYFNFEFKAATGSVFENIFSRGLLYGTDYEVGNNYRGIWGLYGTYDYVAPQIFKVSNTAAALGTTGQWWLSRSVALQGTTLAGVGYGAGGLIHGAGVTTPGPNGEGLRDYHYGVTPQELIALRLIVGDRLSFDTTLRDYYISHLGASESTGSENIARADISMTLRVYNLHGITLSYAESRRDGRYANQPPSQQRVGSVTIGYTLLGQTRVGAVDWRPRAEGGPN